MSIFQSILGLNGLSKKIASVQMKKLQFLEGFCSFQKKYIKKSKCKSFIGSSLTLSAWRTSGSSTGVCRGEASWSVPKSVERERNYPLLMKLEWVSENILFDSEIVLAFNIELFKFALFVSIKCQLFKAFLEWMG